MSKVWFVLAQFIHSTHEKLVVYNGSTGADPGFFLGAGALVSCSTSTPINHTVFFFFLRIPVVLENRRSSQEGGAPPCTPPRSAPGLRHSETGNMTVADPGEGPGGARDPLIFRRNCGPKGQKKKFWRPLPPPPPLTQGLDDRRPPPPLPLISRCGSGTDDRTWKAPWRRKKNVCMYVNTCCVTRWQISC